MNISYTNKNKVGEAISTEEIFINDIEFDAAMLLDICNIFKSNNEPEDYDINITITNESGREVSCVKKEIDNGQAISVNIK